MTTRRIVTVVALNIERQCEPTTTRIKPTTTTRDVGAGERARRHLPKVSALLGLAVVFNPCNIANAFPNAHSRMTQMEDVMTQAPPVQTTLYLLEDLDDASKTRQLASSDLAGLRTVANWIKSFVARPHKDLGRDGPVCPFVPVALEQKTLWLASEHAAGRSVADVIQLMDGYKRRFLHARPIDGDGPNYASMVVVFTDLSADRAKGLFDDVLKQLAVPSYVEDGLVVGAFYESNEGTALYSRGFRPFMSPVPCLLVRHAVISDWKFFLDDDEWLNRWAHRYGESGARALAEELRRLPWREARVMQSQKASK